MRVTITTRHALASSARYGSIESRFFTSSAPSSASHVSAKGKLPVKESIIKPIAQQNSLPRFAVPSENVRLYEHPRSFYSELVGMINRARRRIFIASLYIGKTETKLVRKLRWKLFFSTFAETNFDHRFHIFEKL